MSVQTEQKAQNMAKQGYDEKVINGIPCREYPDFSLYDVYGREVQIMSLSDMALNGGLCLNRKKRKPWYLLPGFFFSLGLETLIELYIDL